MTSGYQGYYDNYQYNQGNYSYNQEGYSQVTPYQEQPPPPPPSTTQYQQPAYNQNNQYHGLCPTNDYANQPNYGTAYNQNNTRYAGGQYTTLNANETQFQSSSTNYGQYLTNDNESSSYGYAQNTFAGTNNAAYSGTPTNYTTFNQTPGAKDFNQNATNYGQRTPENPGYVQSATGYSDNNVYGQNSAYGQASANYQVSNNLNTAANTAYGQTPSVGNGYGQTSGQYTGQFGQNQYQRKQDGVPGQGGDYSDFKFDSQPPPPPPPSHVQQTARSGNFVGNGNSRFQESRVRSQMYDRGSRGRGSGDHYHTRGQGSSRVNRGGHNTFGGQYSHNQTETPRPFNSRGNRGRYGNQSSNRGNGRGGFTRPRDNIQNKDSLPNSDEVIGCDMKSRSNPGKENVPKIMVNEPLESVVTPVTESQSPPTSYVIPQAALMGAGDQPPNPLVEAKLRELMQPLYCRLCSVNLNATSQAQQHYEGKNHAKKVRMFLASSSATSPEKESPSGEGTTDQSEDSDALKDKTKEKAESTPLDEEVYCKICDVSFTSVKQSTQHYQGKNHAKKVRLAAAANITTPSDTVIKGEGSQFECLMCNVHVTSQEQLNMHINGAKHKNKLRLQQRSAQALQGRWVGGDLGSGWGQVTGGGAIEVTGRGGGAGRGFKRPFGKGSGWSTFDDNSRNFQPSGPKRPRQDFSNYRTPSGKFYCSSCNVTLNVESQFAQHVASKRHKTNHAMQRNSSDHADTH